MIIIRHRKPNRLKNFDYSSAGYYFITICTKDRQEYFGNIIDNKMVLNNCGINTQRCWLEIPKHFLNVELDEFQIMPNHIHGIIVIEQNNVGAGFMPALDSKIKRATTRVAPTTGVSTTTVQTIVPTVGNIVGGFKSLTTHEYIMNVKNDNWPSFEKRL